MCERWQATNLETMASYTLREVRQTINQLWDESTAAGWDRVGLAIGNPEQPVTHALLAVDVTRQIVAEAKERGADLLLTHHPLLLRGVHSLAEDTAKGSLAAALIRANIAQIAAHTNADQAMEGVSAEIAHRLGLNNLEPLEPGETEQTGIGRVGELADPLPLRKFAEMLSEILPETAGGVRVAGSEKQMVKRVALCGGAGDSLLNNQRVLTADVYVTSDLRHHPAQEALEQHLVAGGPALIDISHWAAESLWLATAAKQLGELLPEITITVSEINTDPWVFRV